MFVIPIMYLFICQKKQIPREYLTKKRKNLPHFLSALPYHKGMESSKFIKYLLWQKIQIKLLIIKL